MALFGDYWTGELRGNENPTKGELSPRQIEVKPCQCLTWRTEVPATKGESELLQNYFDDCRPGYLIGIVEDALSAHARKKREERNARQAAETKKLFENLPEPPEDLSKQVLKVCSDAGFLWVTNDKQNVIEPGGVEKKISIQRARCDSCGGEYTLSELLKHKSTATCECCGEKMQVRNTRYSVKRLWAARTFLWSKPQGDGVWIRRYLVYFDFRNHRAEPEFHGRGIWWTDGKTIKQWKRGWGEKAQYIMCQRPKLSAMLLAPSGPYQPYTLASHTDQFESDVRKVLKSEWMYQYDNHLNFPWEVRQWEIVNRYPMAESLVKTGWADALCSQVYDEYEHSTRINLRAETYYGVFGLNRQELAAVSQSKKSFREVDNALEWKEAGLAINGKNMAMTANIRKLSGMAKTLQESGMTRSLKYLRQQTRRATGSYNGQIALQVASDWLDYLDMAGQMKMNLNLEKVRFPLDLKRRHDDLVLERNKRRRKDALRGAASSIKRMPRNWKINSISRTSTRKSAKSTSTMERNTSFGYRMEQRPFWKKADFLTTASSAEPDTLSALPNVRATSSSCGARLTRIPRGIPWRWNRAALSAKSAAITTTSTPIWRTRNRLLRNGNRSCRAA